MSHRTRAATLVVGLMWAGGCTSLLGIDEPNVVGEDAGGVCGESGPETGARICHPGAAQACNTYGKQTCTASCTWGACSCPMAPVCVPGAIQCSGSGVQTCDACGQGGSSLPCTGSAPFCAAGACSTEPPSCAPGGPGMSDCGTGTASCCTSLPVVGGTFDRSYDGFTYTNSSSPATVSDFQLDQYEVTVGRFRAFVDAVVGGWLPAAGAGKHTHLNGGQGLSATGGGYETGWDATWNANLATTMSGWNSDLGGGTWTAMAGASEKLPIAEVDWYEAYAFCIWDGGFLPSQAEWNYAAAGGSDQRAYPWSAAFPPGSTAIACVNANSDGCPAGAANGVGSESPAGDGKWGQSDLAGNVWEWALDWYAANLVIPCADCSDLTPAPGRVIRGGSFNADPSFLLASYRGYGGPPGNRFDAVGIRCARTP